MIIKSATGDVDLGQPGNIRRGMVFRLPDGAFCVERYEPSVDAYRSTAGKMLAACALAQGLFVKFLGCDPAYATRSDCERFGLAPSVDAGAHGFARTREGFAVDVYGACAGAVWDRFGDRRVNPPAIAPGVDYFIGLDMRQASAEDVERLCCSHRDARGYLCSLAIGDHAEHEDIAAGVKWKTALPFSQAPALEKALARSAERHNGLAVHEGPMATGSLSFTVNGKTETVRYERETTTAKLQKVLDALVAEDPHASAMVARRSAILTEYTPADYARDLRAMAQSAARETTMRLRHGEATDKGDHFWYIGTCGAAVTSETIPEIVRLATERGKPVKADVNGVAVTAYPGCHVEGFAKTWLATLDSKGDVVGGTWWTDVNFLCPECASINQWGSSRQADGTLRRHCHGHLVQPDGSGKACRFSWPDAEDARWLKNRKSDDDYLVIGAPPPSPVYTVNSTDDAVRIFGKGSEMAGKAREALAATWVDAPIWPTPIVLTIRAGDIPASTVNLTPQAAALRAALSTVDTLTWSAAEKRALRDAAHAVCEMVEATDGKAPAALRGPVTETLAALASAAHVGPAVIGEATKARDAARCAMGRRK